MTLTELQQEVYTLTNRPDLVAETLSAVRAATLKLHGIEFFYKDIYETGIVFDVEDYYQQIEYKTLIPKWRAAKYLRKTTANFETDGVILTPINIPDMVEDQYLINRSDLFYVAGAVVQIKSSTKLKYALLGCYVWPDIAVGNYSSWIAAEYPYAIVYEAAATVFKLVGDTEQFAAFTALSAVEQTNLKLTNIQSIGY